jgi:hypothetical protein
MNKIYFLSHAGIDLIIEGVLQLAMIPFCILDEILFDSI